MTDGARFVDDTKTRGLLIVAAVFAPRNLAAGGHMMRSLCLPRRLGCTSQGTMPVRRPGGRRQSDGRAPPSGIRAAVDL